VFFKARRYFFRGCAIVGLSLLPLACSRQAQPAAAAHIAVLRFENLSPDLTLDWMGRAASEIIAEEISSGKTTVLTAATMHANPLARMRPVAAPGESAEMAAALADGATSVVVGQISLVRNHLMLDVTERDVATGKTLDAFTITSSGPDDLYGAADAAARHLSPDITPFDSRNNQAIADWAHGQEETDPAKREAEYAGAVAADPAFAAAWLAWARSTTAHGDSAAAAKILEEAQKHASGFNELNRARLKLATVELTGDRAATLAAMNEVGKLTPNDANNLNAIAAQDFNARQFQTAAAVYRRLTQITPGNAQVWNQLGYSLMYTGDYAGAMSALQQYQQLVPNDVNAIDSQGDVNFAFGRFSEAEKLYEQSAAKDSNFQNSVDLYKAAFAHLMTGDVAGADKKFEVYAAARRTAKDQTLPFRTAQWRFISGRRGEAMTQLVNLSTSAEPQLKAYALTQRAIWDLQLGARERAMQESNDALKTGAPSPATLLARFASENAQSPAQWSTLADRMLAAPQLAQLKAAAVGYGLYFSHQWPAAEPVWKQLSDRTGTEEPIPGLIYAQILVQLKRANEAEPLVRLYPIPRPDAPQEFVSLTMPEFFATRAAVFASQGKTAEAEASRKVFQALSAESSSGNK
jgi:tetratricopeptide (TPR) repeat protein